MELRTEKRAGPWQRARRPLAILALAATLVLNAAPAAAKDEAGDPNKWSENFRRWPWKGGTKHDLTQIEEHDYASPSAQKAIDVGTGCGKAVYSTSQGTVVAAVNSSGAAGKYVQVTHDGNNDGQNTIVTYEHLQSIEVDADNGGGKPTVLLQGDLIGYSGNTGTRDCHLHFQRSQTTSFQSAALSLGPINGLEISELNLYDDYVSANVGIGRLQNMTMNPAIRSAYKVAGKHHSVGVAANVGLKYSPCRSSRPRGTAWAYACNAGSPYRGTVQTFYGPNYRQRAIMAPEGASTGYLLHTGILSAYTNRYQVDNRDFVFHIGYPKGNRVANPTTGGTQSWTQHFQSGRIDFTVSGSGTCQEKIYRGSTLLATYSYCD